MSVLRSKKVHRRDKIRNVEFEERLLKLSRVVKVVKSGRIFSFTSFVVIGNNNGHVGIGLGKSLEVGGAKRKAINDAKNNLYYIVMTKSRTIPHQVTGVYGGSKVIIRSAPPGTGIIAGSSMRLIFDCLGLKDVVAKSFGSRNPYNVTKATLRALMKLKSKKYFDLFHNPISQKAIPPVKGS